MFNYSVNKYPILKKVWQPEEGKYYKFWSIGYNDPVVALFKGMEYGMYVTKDGLRCYKCTSLDSEEIGK